MTNQSTHNSTSGSPYTDDTLNTSTSSLPPRIVLPSRHSSLSSMDDSEHQKRLTPQSSYPNLTSSIKFSRKKARSLESDGGEEVKKGASEKRNKEFHALFKSVPLEDNLIEDYGCALQKEILLQGRIYITQNHLCFNANIFGWITNLVIAFTDIVEIEKRTTAIFIPNAILISTHQSKHFFASFLSREQAYDQMVTIWRQAQQRVSSSILTTTMKESSDDASDTDDSGDMDDNMSFNEWDNTKMKRTQAVDNILALSPQLTHEHDRQGSQSSLPIPTHASNDDTARRRAMSEAGPRPESIIPHDLPMDSATIASPIQQTQCQCDDHYPNTVMDQTYDCSMETLYNLLYHSGFMTKYLTEVQKSTDVVIHPWQKSDHCPYVRDASYVKYLGGAIGPKSTRCILKEELLHVDLNSHITQQTSTQTPDVPSGSSFCVKTRACLTWAGQGQIRMLVTVLVPFTKSSWLKSTIEKASIDGQINYYKGLDAAIRKYTESRQEETTTATRRRHGKQKDHKKPPRKMADDTPIKTSDIPPSVGLFSSFTPPTLAQCTVICLVLMVITNLYIAAKMINMTPPAPRMDTWRHTHRQDVDSMWQWLEQIEKNPRTSYSQHFLTDKHQRSNHHFAELEKMVQHTEQSVDHVHRLVKQQRQQLLKHYSP